ncbi:MAG: hypothetical protein KKH68_03735 [Proteobacteria bacterium]|nr:hypothetical protein [Pseudomonadota bacterium]
MAFIYLGSKVIPYPPEKQISQIVDITVQIIEDIKSDKEVSPNKPLLQKDEEKSKPKPPVKVKEESKPIPIKKETPIHDEALPDIISRPRIRKKTLAYVKPDMPKTPIFKSSAQSDEIDIRGPLTIKKKFEISKVQSELSPSHTKISIKQQIDPVEIMFQSNRFRKNYAISKKDKGLVTSAKVFTSSQPVDSGEVSLLETGRTDKRYSLEKNIRSSESQALLQTRSNLLSLARQGDTRTQEEDLNIKPMGRSRTAKKGLKPSEGSLMHAKLHKQPYDLSGVITIDEIDPSQLISLNEFNVCIDPQEEFRLKMQLATLLDKPERSGINGVLFFFKYTKSAYTIKVDIYDPRATLSGDRCSVLHLAIESIKN